MKTYEKHGTATHVVYADSIAALRESFSRIRYAVVFEDEAVAADIAESRESAPENRHGNRFSTMEVSGAQPVALSRESVSGYVIIATDDAGRLIGFI